MFKTIPCYAHPTTPVFIDDDTQFLTALVDEFKTQWVCKTFSEPQVALAWLQKMHQSRPTTPHYLTALEDELPEHRFTDLNIQAISEQLYNSERFTKNAVLIVDYTMPKLNGLAFCKELKDTPYKKILLTGAADEKIAVAAFNQGLIHGYLRKDNPLLEIELGSMIATLEQAYFIEQSKVVMETIAVSSTLWSKSLFNSPQFADIFYPFYEQQKPVEYYLSALTGSFLFVDAQGQLSELAVVDEVSMRMFGDFIDEDIPESQREAFSSVHTREKLVAHHVKLIERPTSEWLPHLYPAKKIVFQNQCYYYSYIEKIKSDMIYPEVTVPYQAYLQLSNESTRKRDALVPTAVGGEMASCE